MISTEIPTLAALAKALATRQISSLEVIDAMLKRADAVNAKINAFLRIDHDAARADARQADRRRAGGASRGPLDGIPLAHKDMLFRAGVSSSCGSNIQLPLPQATSTALARLDAAGAVQLGVLNMTPFAVGPTGHNKAKGHCRNPWDLDRISGGSSSGSAAAVAASACYGALGSDTAGSIRVPAAICGVTGLKPTYGRVSRAAAMPFAFSLDTIGPLARTAEDCAIIFDAISGPDGLDPTSLASEPLKTLPSLRQSARGLRIGIPRTPVEDLPSAISRPIAASLEVFEDLGCEVVEIDLPDFTAVNAAAALIIACEGAAVHQNAMRQQRSAYGRQILVRLERGFAVSAPAYIDALRYRAVALQALVESAFSRANVLCMPVLPIATPTIVESDIESAADVEKVVGELTRLTRPFNYLGMPALAVPAGFAEDGLPVSIQLVGRPLDEALLLRLGSAYQNATDWHLRRPPL